MTGFFGIYVSTVCCSCYVGYILCKYYKNMKLFTVAQEDDFVAALKKSPASYPLISQQCFYC